MSSLALHPLICPHRSVLRSLAVRFGRSMSTSSRLLAASLLIPPLVLEQHLRLRSAYPTRHITPSLEISTRSDAPAVGMSSSSGWLRPDAGEEFTADVPARLLAAGDGTTPMSIVFARAFWGSWPLALERRLVKLLVRLNVGPFGLRGGGLEGVTAAEAERNFEPKAKVIGGLFIVEAHDAHPTAQPDTNIAGPIICSWWLKPVAVPSKDSVGVAGGYHSFSVETLSTSPLSPAEPMVRLHFTCHMVLSGNAPANKDPEASTRPSEEITGLLSFTQRVLMTFHVFYARLGSEEAEEWRGVVRVGVSGRPRFMISEFVCAKVCDAPDDALAKLASGKLSARLAECG